MSLLYFHHVCLQIMFLQNHVFAKSCFFLQIMFLQNMFSSCLFANFSDPKGCYIVLECTSDNIIEHKFNLTVQENLYISEAGNISCAGKRCTAYNVYAYDIISNGSIGALAWSETNSILCPPSNCKFKIFLIMSLLSF